MRAIHHLVRLAVENDDLRVALRSLRKLLTWCIRPVIVFDPHRQIDTLPITCLMNIEIRRKQEMGRVPND